MKLSNLLCIMLLGLAISCGSTAQIGTQPEPVNSHGLFAAYSSNFSSESEDYLQILLSKLWTAIPNPSTNRYHVLVLDSSDPLALTLGSGYVVLSKGLILNLNTEGELFFVIAHEVAHHELGHTEDKNKTTANRELEADAFAVTSLLRAGYPADDAISAVVTLSKAVKSHKQNYYPSLETRVLALKNSAQSNQDFPVSHLRSNRAFMAFRGELNG